MAQSEVRTRILFGLVMALIAAGILAADGHLAAWLGRPFYPCLFVGALLLTLLSAVELHALMAGMPRPPRWLLVGSTLALFLANWPAHLGWLTGDPFRHVLFTFAGCILVGFLYEMAVYRPNDSAVPRLASFLWALAYVGVLPAFFVQLRYQPDWPDGDLRGVAALAALIAVPKCADIGAFFTGRFLGRHKMSPTLSPKKTWEGFAGGVALSTAAAILIHRLVAPLFHDDLEAGLFGVVVGIVGVLGDLAESFIKRECGAKDASKAVPGFGGILDVVDSVLFAGPVAYWWLMCWRLG